MPPELPAPYVYQSEQIYIPLDASLFAQLPNFIDHGTVSLQKKTEFHVTLVSVEEIILTVGATVDIRHKDIEEQVLGSFKTFVESTPLSISKLSDDVRFVSERGNQAILVRCVVPHLEEFTPQLNKIFGTTIPVQPTHITLYTLQPNIGIHVTSETQMAAFARVEIPSINRALGSIQIGV